MTLAGDVLALTPTLHGASVNLVPLGLDVDVIDYENLVNDSELNQFTGTTRTFSRDELRAWLASRPSQTDRADWAVRSAATDAVLGESALLVVDFERGDASYRILLGPDARDRGIGTEVTKLVTAFAFGVGFRRVHLEVLHHNHRAQRVYAKCGFVPDAPLSQDTGSTDLLVMIAQAPRT